MGGFDRGRCRTTQATLAVRARATDHARRVLPIIIELRGAGISSLGKIARELRRRGVRTARGGQWHPMTVGRLLARRRLAGCPMTLPEKRAEHARCTKSLVQRLMVRGFDNIAKLSAELNRNDELTFTARQWSPNSLGMYLKHHFPRIYDSIMCGGHLKVRQIGTAIDRLDRQGVVALAAIAAALKKEGVPTLSGNAMWTARMVDDFFRRSHRTRTTAKIKVKTAQIAVAIDRLKQHGIVTLSALAEGLNKDRVPTLSGTTTWSESLVHYFLKKLGRTKTAASIKARTAQIDAEIECLKKQGVIMLVAIAPALNEKCVPTPSGRGRWSRTSLHAFLKTMGRTKTAASIEVQIQQTAAVIERLKDEGISTLSAIAKALNENGIPTLSGRGGWTQNSVHEFLKKLGRTKKALQFEAKAEQIRPVLNGIVRRHGRMGAARIADKFNEKGVPTASGNGIWTGVMVRTLYRRLGRPLKTPRFWTNTRVARVVELREAGKTLAAIAEEFVEYGISQYAVSSVLRRYTPRPSKRLLLKSYGRRLLAI